MAAVFSMAQSVSVKAPTSTIPLTQNTAPVKEFRCLYTHDLRQKKKRWQDGFLRYHTFNKRIMVYDTSRNFIADMHYTDSGEVAEGDDLTFDVVLVQLQEYLQTTEQDLTALLTARASKAAEVRHQSNSQAQVETLSRRPQAKPPFRPHGTNGEPSQNRPQTPQTPLSQLRPKSLNSLLGTVRGPHGRAVLPAFSPFEERRRKEDEETKEGRASKRLKRDTITKGGANDMEMHVSISRTGQNSISRRREEPVWARTANRRRHIDQEETVIRAPTQNVASRTYMVTGRLNKESNLLSSPKPAVQEPSRLNTPKQSTLIHIESDSEPAAERLKTNPKCGRKIRATSPKVRTGTHALPQLQEKSSPQLQPLHVLASRSTRKKKLLCQELGPHQRNVEMDTLTRFHQQQQARLQSRLEGRQVSHTNSDLYDLSQPDDFRDDNRTRAGTADQTREKTPQLTIAATSNEKRTEHIGNEIANTTSARGPTIRQPPAAGGVDILPSGDEEPGPTISADARQKGNREVSKQSSTSKEPRPLSESGRQHGAPTTVSNHKSALEIESGGAWAEEAFDLFEWRPPATRGKKTED